MYLTVTRLAVLSVSQSCLHLHGRECVSSMYGSNVGVVNTGSVCCVNVNTVNVCLPALSQSQFLVSFDETCTVVGCSKGKNEFVGVNI